MAQPTDLAARIGTVLAGTYRLDEQIGEGGMGAVFRGHDLRRGFDVAIKILHPDYTRDPELARRFDREAQSAARLDHPNCIRVHGFGTADDGTKYIVMELLAGEELQRVAPGVQGWRRAIDLILQVVAGLEHAHAQGLVHRDLKPANILVTRDHTGHEGVKIVDFGVAKILHGDGAGEQMTRAGMLFGTPQYMSPEQALGQEIDARTDLYAVGILLHALVTGQLPFVSDDLVTLIRMQVSGEPPPLPGHVPAELAAVIQRLLAKHKEQRYPDAAALRGALERIRDAGSPGSSKIDPTVVELVVDPSTSGTSPATPLPAALRPRTIGLLEAMMDTAVFHRSPPQRLALVGGLLAMMLVITWWLLRG